MNKIVAKNECRFKIKGDQKYIENSNKDPSRGFQVETILKKACLIF
jgi:hypothetical protein